MGVELYDAGHGIDTLGKCSPDMSLREYKKARELVKDIVTRRRAMGYDARILVPEDKDISLKERCRRVNAVCQQVGKSNVLLVSVHCNAAGCSTQPGSEPWKCPASLWKGPELRQSKRRLPTSKTVPLKFKQSFHQVKQIRNLLGQIGRAHV